MRWSLFDIVGPIMVGPSSSHTSGAVRLGLLANILLGGIPDKAEIYLHGSYAEVYKGHGTDKAIVAGLLGFSPDSEKVVSAFEEAKKVKLKFTIIPTDMGIEYHPNTVRFILKKGKSHLDVFGSSLGAGKVEIIKINNIPTSSVDGKYETLITFQRDVPGMIAKISNIFAKHKLNVAQLNMGREKKGGNSLAIFNLDNQVPNETFIEITAISGIEWARVLPKLT